MAHPGPQFICAVAWIFLCLIPTADGYCYNTQNCNSNQRCDIRYYGGNACCLLEGEYLGNLNPTDAQLATCCNYKDSCAASCADGKCPHALRRIGEPCIWNSGCYANHCAMVQHFDPYSESGVCACIKPIKSMTWSKTCDVIDNTAGDQVCCNNTVCSKSLAYQNEVHCCLPYGATCTTSGDYQLCCGGNCVSGVCDKALTNGPCTQSSDCASSNLCDTTTNRCKAIAGKPCKLTSNCVSGAGLVCDLGTETCITCIADGVRCCSATDCSSGSSCIGGECVAAAYLYCAKDQSQRLLNQVFVTIAALTVEKCQYVCFTGSGGSGVRYKYAAVKYGSQCFCGNALATQETATNCDMACAGNSAQTCGGSWAANLYINNNASGQHTNVLYCAKDASTRLLATYSFSSSTMTTEKCISGCFTGGNQYNYAAAEYSSQCYCGNVLTTADTAANCNMACAGNSAQTCGGSWAANLFTKTEFGCGWKFLYCSADHDSRLLYGDNTASDSLSSDSCLEWCRSRGHTFAGPESGNQCYCANSLAFLEPASTCNQACTGNAAETCGGAWALGLYAYTCRNDAAWGSWASSPCKMLPSSYTAVDEITITSAHLTQSLCQTFCYANGKTVAAIVNGNECHCSNTVPDDTFTGCTCTCSSHCSGATSQTCGGPTTGCVCVSDYGNAADYYPACNFVVDSAN